MPENIEIKARVSDPAALLRRAQTVATKPPVEILQSDTFFNCATGRLKLREFTDGTAELIQYHRPDLEGPKVSQYRIHRVQDPAPLRRMLEAALGLRGVVRKRRLLVMVGRTRVHLDHVEGLGDFMELEVVLEEGEDHAAGDREAAALMEKLGVAPQDLVEGAYIDLLEVQD